MKKICKVAALLMALLLAVGVLAGCQSTNTGEGTLDKIKANGKITMLTNAQFAPFEYIKDNEVAGVDVELAQAIADEIGVELEITDMDFDAIIDFLNAGKGDFAAAGLTVNEERKAVVDFSIEYVTSTQYVIIPKDADPATYDLNGKIIGVQAGTTGDLYYASVEDYFKAGEVKRYKSAVDAVAEMKAGRVDCVMIDELPAKKLVEENPEYIAYDPGYPPESYAIAVQKGNTELLDVINKVLQKLVDEGKIEELVVKHS